MRFGRTAERRVIVALGLHGLGCLLSTGLMPPAAQIGFIALVLLAVALLIAVGASDPGVLARRTDEEYVRKVQTPSYGYVVEECEGSILGRRIIDCAGMRYEVFCSTCGIFRPKGTSHCRWCDGCIAGMDHHCPWVGNCIGEKNHGLFLYLLSVDLVCAGVLGWFWLANGTPVLEVSFRAAGLLVRTVCCLGLAFLSVFLWGYFMVLYLYGATSRAVCRKRARGQKVLLAGPAQKFSDGS